MTESTAQQQAVDEFAAAPGKKTSEYSATVFAQFLSGLVALIALFSPGFEIDSTAQTVIVGFAASAYTFSQMAYSWSRAKVKTASAEATAAVSQAVVVE